MNAADYLLANAALDDVALVDAGREYTYRELRMAAGRMAANLSALALPRGAPVALLGRNSPFWVASYLAVLKLGLVAVPLPDRLGFAEVVRNIQAVGCSTVCADQRALRGVYEALSGLAVITDEVLATSAAPCWPDHVPSESDDDAVLMFTSGTTSTPKAVRVTHRNIQANTASILAYLGLGPDDRMLVVLPFYYCFGSSLLHTHLRSGARLVLCNSLAFPESVVDMLEQRECTGFAGVPSSYQLLLRTSSFARRPLPHLRQLQQAGGRLPAVMIEEMLAARHSAELFVMYGQTEATARLSYLPPDRLRDKLGSIGRGIPGVELRVLDDTGRPVPPGVQGEIYARGESISPGYLGDPAASTDKFTPDGLRTGDLAVVDDDGFIYVVDRRDDFIKSWGYRISSQEVETCALRMADLVSAAAVGVPDNDAGEAVVLFVTRRPSSGVSEHDVLSYCRARLPGHMAPRAVFVLDDLPLNANGKVVKARLRAMAVKA